MRILKSIVLFFLILMSILSFARCDSEVETPEELEALDIYLLIGQSNMQGVAPIGILDKVTLENVYLYNNKGSWEKAKNMTDNGINRYSTVKKNPTTLLGPGYTFGRRIAEYSHKKIGLVSNARGATRLEWWIKGYAGENDYNLYEEAVKRAQKGLENSPAGSKIKGILWHQGEANNASGRHIGYMENLQILVNDLRSDLGDPNIAFIVGEVGKWNDRGLNINPVLRSVKSNIPNSDWVSSDGLTSIDLANNDPHFDNLSQRVLGGRYADKAAELIYDIKAEGVTLYSKVNFEGRSVLLNEGEYSGEKLESMGIQPEELYSAKVDPGFELTIYTNSGDEVITQDNDSIKSYKSESISIKRKIN